MITCANLKPGATWSMSYQFNENSWEYHVIEVIFKQVKDERSYIWTAENDMKIWLIVAAINTTYAVVKLKPE